MSGDINSQAFWNEFMRRPDAKAAYQAERRLQDGIFVWAFLKGEHRGVLRFFWIGTHRCFAEYPLVI